MKKNDFFNLINSNETEYIMEAHNAISAKIVENAGFHGIWGSGLTISASLGFRDNNEASYTDIFNVANTITKNINIPVVLDIDSGYGNFNNARLCVKEANKIGISVLCIEDKMYPKMNSYVNNTQLLIDSDVFVNKILAMKEVQKDFENPIGIIARTEALITNNGLDEALRRAYKYADAGADAIFIHSKRNNIGEISEFMKRWDKRLPVIISPTTYDNTNPKIYSEIGIGIVIWGNYMLRASIEAMERVSKKIQFNRTPEVVRKDICDVQQIFDLVNLDEYLVLENKYMV